MARKGSKCVRFGVSASGRRICRAYSGGKKGKSSSGKPRCKRWSKTGIRKCLKRASK